MMIICVPYDPNLIPAIKQERYAMHAHKKREEKAIKWIRDAKWGFVFQSFCDMGFLVTSKIEGGNDWESWKDGSKCKLWFGRLLAVIFGGKFLPAYHHIFLPFKISMAIGPNKMRCTFEFDGFTIQFYLFFSLLFFFQGFSLNLFPIVWNDFLNL